MPDGAAYRHLASLGRHGISFPAAITVGSGNPQDWRAMDLSATDQTVVRASGNGRRAVRSGASRAVIGLSVLFSAVVATSVYATLLPETLGPTASALLVGMVSAAAAIAGYAILRPILDRSSDDQLLALLGKAIEAGPEGRLITDSRGVAAYANRAYRDLLRAPPDSDRVPDPSGLKGASEEDGQELARLKAAAEKGEPARAEVDIVALDDSRGSIAVEVCPLGDAGHVVWLVSDIGRRRELERQAAEQQAELSAFLDHAPVGFYAVDGEGRFLFVNNTLTEWLGRPRGDFIKGGLTLADVIDAGVGNGLRAEDLLQGVSVGKVTLRGARGNEFPAEISQQAVFGSDGRVRYLSGAIRDLTQEATVQAALVQAEERFRRFFDFVPIGVVSLDDSLLVSESNAAFRALIGDLGDGVGRPFVDLVREEDRSELLAALQAARRGDVNSNPVEVRLRGDSQRVAQLFASRMMGPDSQSSGVVMHLIDTTEQKNLELQFAQSQKMQAVGQLAGGIAHDFNNLLTAMIGFCDLLLMRHQAGDESFSDIMQIKQNANRAANLVRQLLAFSRQQTLRPQVLDVTDVLSELSHLLRRLIGETIELKMVHGRDLGLVKVDYGQLEQVIINLAVNARDAMADLGGGVLTITTSNLTAEESTHLNHELMPPGAYVVVEVKDSGHGIAQENLGKIFEPFFTTKEVGAGTGLGLSTVYGIVKQTGGFIFPESRPGEGAIFRIYLPRYVREGDDASARSAEPASIRDLTGKGMILLVEDEDAVRTFAARALRNKGYTVLEADSGESALKVVDEHEDTIDLLISDVVMPLMDGPTLVKNVRERRPKTKIIFISGYAEDAFRKSLNQQDNREMHFLPKPFSLKQLAGKVKEVMTSDQA